MANPRQNRAQKGSAAKKNTSRPETATRDELNKRILSLEVQLEKANERAKSDNPLTSARAEATANRLANDIMRLQDRLDAMGKSTRTPTQVPKLPDYGMVKPAPGSKLKDEGPARSRPPMPKNRPSTVDTQSKKPIAKRIMEALGDNRTMEQATKDREMNKQMEKEAMGRKKGGMAKKKKAPVKKAYGGMVKKKQGGSANKVNMPYTQGGSARKVNMPYTQGGSARKVNMKAGFTRRGCSKG